MRSPNVTQTPQHQSLNPIIILSLFLGSFITLLLWLDVSTQIITLLFWLSLGATGFSALLHFRSNSANSVWFRLLIILSAVSLVYLFPELFRPICGKTPRVFALPSSGGCRVCLSRVCEWNPKKHKQHCYCDEWDRSACPDNNPVNPPTIEATLNCSQWGQQNWCSGTLLLDLAAAEPQGKDVLISGDVNGVVFACPTETGLASCSVPLPEGAGTANYTATSITGLTSSGSTSFQQDSIQPEVFGILSGTDGNNGWFVSPVDVIASATDPVPGSGMEILEYSLNGGNWDNFIVPLNLLDGVHSLALRATDVAGNIVETSQIIQVDTITPTLDLSINGSLGENGWYRSAVEVNATASDDGSGIAFFEASTEGSDWTTFTTPLVFNDGQHNYRFRAIDFAGNLTETPLQSLSVDTIPPAIDVPSSWNPGQAIPFKLQDDGSGLASLRWVVEDEDERYPKVAWNEGLSGNKFKDDFTWNGRFKDGTIAPPGGEYYAWLKVTDVAGNENMQASQVIVEDIAPSTTNILGIPTVATDTPSPVEDGETALQSPPSQTLPPLSNALPKTIFGGRNNDAQPSFAQAGVRGFNAGGQPTSPTTGSQSNILWEATATASIGAFAAEIALQQKKKKKKRRVRRDSGGDRRAASNYRQKIHAKKQEQLERKWRREKQAAKARKQAVLDRQLAQKEVKIEVEMRSNLTKAQAQQDAAKRAKQKAYDTYRAQEVAAQTKITPPKEIEKKSLKAELEKKITQTAMTPKLGRYGAGVQAIGDSLRSIGDPNRNPRTAEAHNQIWAGIAAWDAIFEMRKEAKEYTTQAIKDRRWRDAFRGISAIAKQNVTLAAGTTAATGIALWGLVTTPIRIFTHDVPEFIQAGKERWKGKDRFWDVLFTGSNLVGDVTALYGGYQAAGRMNIVNKINSTAADQFGIGTIKRTYTFEGTDYIYRYNPYKETALGYLEDLKGLPPKKYNYLNDVPKEIYDNTNIQFDFLMDIENSKIKPKYFSNPAEDETRVFSYVEHRYIEKIVTEPNAWTSNFRVRWKAFTNGLLASFQRR